MAAWTPATGSCRVRELPPEWRPAEPIDWEAWDWVDWLHAPVFWGALAGISCAVVLWLGAPH
jgi:hypothetical protein